MATPDADEMEQFQRLSDQYQANLPVRSLTNLNRPDAKSSPRALWLETRGVYPTL